MILSVAKLVFYAILLFEVVVKMSFILGIKLLFL